ncbi:MAG: hypothetical protein KF861_07100 [Planctomycetaceae bacterium]|nr:hypothetical protein [Planctomycetaceae bacterium]
MSNQNEWLVLADQFHGCGDVTLRWTYNGDCRSMTSVGSDWGGQPAIDRYVALARRAGELLGDASSTPQCAWYEALEQMRPLAVVTTRAVEVLNDDRPAVLRSLELPDAAGVSRQVATELASGVEPHGPPVATEPAAEPGLAAIMSAADRAVLAIAHSSDKRIDEKMRQIAVVKPESVHWKATRWAELLGVTDSRIRQTETWKAWRAADKKSD